MFILANNCYAVDVNESIKSTIENNPKVKAAYEKINESKELIKYSLGSKLPEITGTVSGTYLNSDTDTSTTSSTSETLKDSYKIVISKNLYDSGIKNLEIERSKILFDNELINFKSKIQDLILDAINGYLSVVNFNQSLKANKKNYDSVLKALDETKTRYSLGSATLYDLQNAEASFALATTNLYEAEQNLLIGKKTFKKIVGLEANNLEDFIEIDTKINLEKIIASAMKDNLNLNLMSNDIKNNEILVLKEKKSKKPTLDITGTGLYSNGTRLDNGTETTSGSVSISLNIPIFKKGQDNSNIRKYQSKLLQAEINLQDSIEDLEIVIANTFKDFKVNQSKMKSNLIIIKSIKTSLESLEAEYKIGTKTISELVDKEEELLNANVRFLNSKKEFLLNYFKLKSLDGSLIILFEDYIKPIN